MQRFLTIILTVAVLVHTTFGCCTHHAHSCEVGCVETPMADAKSSPCSGHRGHREHEHGEHGEPTRAVSLNTPGDCDHEHPNEGTGRCEGGKCSFAQTESSPTAQSLKSGAFSADLVLPVISVVRTVDAPIAGTLFKPDAASGTPHRHLVLAVLLI